MKIAFFMQSYTADYNFGCAHFMRGLIRELVCDAYIKVFSPSNTPVLDEAMKLNADIVNRTYKYYPMVDIHIYQNASSLEDKLQGFDAIIVNEWIDDDISNLIAGIGKKNNIKTFYYDTHHRIITDLEGLMSSGVGNYDCVLVLGENVKKHYIEKQIHSNVVIYQEAVDDHLFKRKNIVGSNVIWIGNYGHGERGASLMSSLYTTSRQGINTICYGTGYPEKIVTEMYEMGVNYKGWISNIDVQNECLNNIWMLHIPRSPYDGVLSGVPNIRPFEAAGLGVPLVVISLEEIGPPFVPNEHYILFRTVDDYIKGIFELKTKTEYLRQIADNSYNLICEGHRCKDRATQLLKIIKEVNYGVGKA